jgi:hypothetical protein
VSGLLHTERRRLGTRAGRQSLGCYRQAILVLRWLLDGTRIIQLAVDNQISRSTGYAYLHEGLAMLAAHAPGLESVLLAAKIAGNAHLDIDGTLIETDRCRTPGPTPGVDLWWSGKHDTTALRHHGEILPLLTAWTDDDPRILGDLGYEGEATTITVAFKRPKNAACADLPVHGHAEKSERCTDPS